MDEADQPVGTEEADGDEHVPPPSTRQAVTSLVLLMMALIAVVGNARGISPTIEKGGVRWRSSPASCSWPSAHDPRPQVHDDMTPAGTEPEPSVIMS